MYFLHQTSPSVQRTFDPGGITFIIPSLSVWLVVVYFMYAAKDRANHSIKKEDDGAMKEKILPCTIVPHSSNEKVPKHQDAPGSSYKESKQYHYEFQQNIWQLM
eukprot:13545151-Ditylum_brightwellii.AAC.1